MGAGARPATELEAILEPMLAAIVRLAGANAGTVRVIGADGTCFEPVVSVGIPGSKTGAVPRRWPHGAIPAPSRATPAASA